MDHLFSVQFSANLRSWQSYCQLKQQIAAYCWHLVHQKHTTPQKPFRNDWRNMTNSSACQPGHQILLISIQLTFTGCTGTCQTQRGPGSQSWAQISQIHTGDAAMMGYCHQGILLPKGGVLGLQKALKEVECLKNNRTFKECLKNSRTLLIRHLKKWSSQSILSVFKLIIVYILYHQFLNRGAAGGGWSQS